MLDAVHLRVFGPARELQNCEHNPWQNFGCRNTSGTQRQNFGCRTPVGKYLKRPVSQRPLKRSTATSLHRGSNSPVLWPQGVWILSFRDSDIADDCKIFFCTLFRFSSEPLLVSGQFFHTYCSVLCGSRFLLSLGLITLSFDKVFE